MTKEFILEVIRLLNKHSIIYLIVGGCAEIFYGQKTFTKDLDVYIPLEFNTLENIHKFLNEFNSKSEDITAFEENKIIRLITSPFTIDLLPKIDGVSAEEAFNNYTVRSIGSEKVNIISQSLLSENYKFVKNKIDART